MPNPPASPLLPFPSLEVRWFLDGEPESQPELLDWFLRCRPVSRHGEITDPQWQGRLNDEPDVYLVLPGNEDMGIKWREGALQIKGRVASLGTEIFAGRHYGHAQRWLKWSYGELPAGYRHLFTPQADLQTVEVHKTRLLRQMQLNTFTGAADEVAPDAMIDRGLSVELSRLVVAERAYTSVCFEAFPDDSGMDTAFNSVVNAFLAELDGPLLAAEQSFGYPGWLASLLARPES